MLPARGPAPGRASLPTTAITRRSCWWALAYALGQYTEARKPWSALSATSRNTAWGAGAFSRTLLGGWRRRSAHPQAAQTHFGLMPPRRVKDRQLMQDGVTLGMRYLDVGN